MPEVTEVEVGAVDPERFDSVLDKRAGGRRSTRRSRTRASCSRGAPSGTSTPPPRAAASRRCSTRCLPYARGVGVDTRWLVIGGDDKFFVITKRIHNRLHGAPGDGQGLSDDDRRHYEEVLRGQAEQLKQRFRKGDVVILHDPQTAGLIPPLVDAGFCVVWRCHVGLDTPNEDARETWNFLLPYVRRAARCIFSRRGVRLGGPRQGPHHRGGAVDRSRSPPRTSRWTPRRCTPSSPAPASSTTATRRRRRTRASTAARAASSTRRRSSKSSRLDAETPLVVQVSRWDRLKDPHRRARGLRRRRRRRSATLTSCWPAPASRRWPTTPRARRPTRR